MVEYRNGRHGGKHLNQTCGARSAITVTEASEAVSDPRWRIIAFERSTVHKYTKAIEGYL